MFRIIVTASFLISMATASFAAPGATPSLSFQPSTLALTERLLNLSERAPNVINAGCCRRCMGAYKACGNSCVKRNYVCRRGRGCAC